MKEEMKGNQDDKGVSDKRSDRKTPKNRFSRMKVLAASIMTVFALGAASGCKTDQKCSNVTSCGDATICQTIDASVVDGAVNDAEVTDAAVSSDASVSDANVSDGSVNDADVSDALAPDANMVDGGFTEDAAIADGSVDSSVEDASVQDAAVDANMSIDADVDGGSVEDGGVSADSGLADAGIPTGTLSCDATELYPDSLFWEQLWYMVPIEFGGMDLTYVDYQGQPMELTMQLTCDGSEIMQEVIPRLQWTTIPLVHGYELEIMLMSGNANYVYVSANLTQP